MEHSKEVEQNCSKVITLVIKALVEIFFIKMGHATQLIPVVISTFRVFQIVIESEVGGGREGILPSGGRNQKFYWEGFFLPGKGNLRRSNFDDSKLKATFHEW